LSSTAGISPATTRWTSQTGSDWAKASAAVSQSKTHFAEEIRGLTPAARFATRGDVTYRGTAGSEELAQLGRTVHRRRHDVLAYFDHHASNGPTEAINGRLEARRNAFGFRNLTHYRIRSLLHCGNLAQRIDAL
jgi:transposase